MPEIILYRFGGNNNCRISFQSKNTFFYDAKWFLIFSAEIRAPRCFVVDSSSNVTMLPNMQKILARLRSAAGGSRTRLLRFSYRQAICEN